MKILKTTIMETKQIFETDPLDVVKPATNISDSLNKKKYINYNTEWHIASCPTESNKSTKTVIFTNHLEDQGNQYKHFF